MHSAPVCGGRRGRVVRGLSVHVSLPVDSVTCWCRTTRRGDV